MLKRIVNIDFRLSVKAWKNSCQIDEASYFAAEGKVHEGLPDAQGSIESYKASLWALQQWHLLAVKETFVAHVEHLCWDETLALYFQDLLLRSTVEGFDADLLLHSF